MSIAAIPTIYRNVQFRSRLEARWAAFFTLAGWDWHYEPIDLDGWIPDFVIVGKKGNQIYVEVKPIFFTRRSCNIDDPLDTSKMLSHDLDKVFRNRFFADESDGNEALVIGANIVHGDFDHDIFIGAFVTKSQGCTTASHDLKFNLPPVPIYGYSEELWERPGLCFDPAKLFKGYQQELDLNAHNGQWNYRIGGESGNEGSTWGDGHLLYTDWSLIERLWAEAGNSVQWRRPRPRR